HPRSFYFCLFFYCSGDPRVLHSFPTRRSSDLLNDRGASLDPLAELILVDVERRAGQPVANLLQAFAGLLHDVVELIAHDVADDRSEEHTSELQSRENLVCRLLLEKKKDDTTKT